MPKKSSPIVKRNSPKRNKSSSKTYERPERKQHTKMSEKLYTKLIDGLKNDTLSDYQRKKVLEAMNINYCECIEDVNQTNKIRKTDYNPYAVCNTSIYTNRGLEIPPRANYSCREKYYWFREPR